MRILLDTHILLWALNDDPKLPAAARAMLEDGETTVFVSAVTIWEIAIKHARRAAAMPISGREALRLVEASDFELLAVTHAHAASVDALPPLHRDPFDRLLAAQAIFEPLRLVTSDARLAPYSDTIILV